MGLRYLVGVEDLGIEEGYYEKLERVVEELSRLGFNPRRVDIRELEEEDLGVNPYFEANSLEEALRKKEEAVEALKKLKLLGEFDVFIDLEDEDGRKLAELEGDVWVCSLCEREWPLNIKQWECCNPDEDLHCPICGENELERVCRVEKGVYGYKCLVCGTLWVYDWHKDLWLGAEPPRE